jgi:hypothetical protein
MRQLGLAPPWTAALSAVLGACSSAAPGPLATTGGACNDGGVVPWIVHGAAEEHYLGLAHRQQHAVIEIVDPSHPDRGVCSGTFVSVGWVLTAKHCLAIPSLQVMATAATNGAESLGFVQQSIANPDADVALLAVAASPGHDGPLLDSGTLDIAPLRVSDPADTVLELGRLATLAGYGLTERGTIGELHFATERVIALDDATITMDGRGKSGACAGDSGGPLLVRAKDGVAEVVGVLAQGSTSCLDTDTYVRASAIASWVRATIRSPGKDDHECGAITDEGRCLYGTAMWCVGTTLAVAHCAGRTVCGWDQAQRGFRCVLPGADPCAGFDSIGGCDADNAASCTNGTLSRQNCGPCTHCTVDPSTARPTCSAAP